MWSKLRGGLCSEGSVLHPESYLDHSGFFYCPLQVSPTLVTQVSSRSFWVCPSDTPFPRAALSEVPARTLVGGTRRPLGLVPDPPLSGG